MSTITRTRRAFAVGSALVAVALGATACSSTSTAASDTDATSSAAAGDVIVAAADPSLLPYNFLGDDNSTWEGINVDLAAALSDKLGRTIEFESAGFDTIIPGLQSGRYDMALTGMFDTQERQKTVDFVDYLGSKNNFLESADVADITDFSDLCGLTVGLPAGALEIDMVTEASTACTDAGEDSITLNTYDDLNAVILALTSGRVDVAPNDSATNAYVLKQQGDGYKVTGAYSTDGYFAAAFPQKSDLMADVQTAFQEITDDGTYQSILDDWGIGDRALDAPLTNASPF